MITIGSLFSGIGGLELGLEVAIPGARVVWQAERDPYASAVLAKHWPTVKRYGDVREINETAERPTIICGGFPCQDISNAGKQAGIGGQRSGLWSEFARIVRVLRPDYVVVENVAALLVRGIDRVLGDLSACGYDAQWETFRASDVGAPHLRERLFILAHANSEPGRKGSEVTDCDRKATGSGRRDQLSRRCEDVAHANGTRQPQPQGGDEGQRRRSINSGEGAVVNASGIRGHAGHEGTQDGNGSRHRFPPGPANIRAWDGAQPTIRRGDDGTAGRVDRLRCLGNAVVPQVAALAWETLSARAAI